MKENVMKVLIREQTIRTLDDFVSTTLHYEQ